jgi:7-cyano-7-deazaguanine synthase
MSIPELREASDIKGATELKGVSRTYIPMKNAVFYSLGAAYAEEKGSNYIIGGHNADDMRVFDDTSEEFFARLEKTLQAGSRRLRRSRLRVLRPLKAMTKVEVVRTAARLGVPLELTWSCHLSGKEHCWHCEGCEGRILAFREAGLVDPLSSKKV